jgi:hypothetical protein
MKQAEHHTSAYLENKIKTIIFLENYFKNKILMLGLIKIPF